MKKSVFMGLVAVLGLIGCTRNQEIDIPENGLTLVARTESPADTKTVVEEGVHVCWEPGDEIAVFMGEKSAKFTTDLTAPSGTATFKGTFGDESWSEELDLWAVYPYSEDATFDGETITTVLPSEQVAREGSFGKDMNLSIAHSTSSSVQFYNVGGGLRFSVTEEGIKKVMFEGLSGEIISGKVKIAFDENGTPVVKEVSGGSQFITLLPPSGKEAFETGIWYYIVAIPGSLEGGYKLRFYRDSDYARLVSEKTVEIKRSIYGNIEKADEGIEYEATTTKFPETEDEWVASDALTRDISASIASMTSSIIDSGSSLVIDELMSEISKLDGIASINTSDSGLLIKQSNGVFVNLILNQKEDNIDENMKSRARTKSSALSSDIQRGHGFLATTVPTVAIKKAVVISPFQDDYPEAGPVFDIEYLTSTLSEIGFSLDPLYKNNLRLEYFTGDNLSQYDLILIGSHGADRCTIMDGSLISTAVNTGIEVGTLNQNVNRSLLALAICDGKPNYYLTVPWLEATTSEPTAFSKSIVYFGSCRSFKDDDFANFFRQRKSAFCGHRWIMAVQFDNMVAHSLVTSLSCGMSFSNALENMTRDPWMISEYNRLSGGALWLFNPFGSAFPWQVGTAGLRGLPSSLHLIDSTPINLHNSEISDGRTTLIWDQAKNIGNFKFKVHIKRPDSGSYSTFDSTTSNSYSADVHQSGEYSWYVEANLYYEGNIIETFTSDTKSFTVTDSPSSEETLVSRTYGGKSYSVIRKDVSTSDCRINGDGSKFYPCSYSVKVDNKEYELPGPFYSYQTDRPHTDMGPVLAVDSSTVEMNVFFIEKDVDEYYGMCGYVFTISGNSITQWTLFTGSNFGWFPYFERNDNQLLLNIFSYAGYFSIIGMQDEDWALYYNEDIYPDDFKAKQDQNELIMIY